MSGSFIQELKRRNVFRVSVIYVIVSWLLMQIGDVMFPALRLPEWTTTMLVAFLLLCFPVALILAWAYEVTPDGVKRTKDVVPGESITDLTGRKINYIIIVVLALAVAYLTGKIWLEDDTAPPGTAAFPDKSIAVLPFANNSAAEENAEFFADGVHDELLTLLSRLGGIKVISRTSVENLKDGLSIPEIGALLGVATVLEGQVQRAGDRLRINVQLIDAVKEDHLWATTYDR
jgi:TolB-like protein